MCVLQVHNRAITMPGRALAGVIAEMKSDLPIESSQLLDSFHQDVVSYLKAMSADDAQKEGNAALQSRLQDKLTDLKALGHAGANNTDQT